MKKLGFLLVVLSLTVVGLAGCKKDSSSSTTTTTPAADSTSDTNDSGTPAAEPEK